jgi:hypothetical protein
MPSDGSTLCYKVVVVNGYRNIPISLIIPAIGHFECTRLFPTVMAEADNRPTTPRSEALTQSHPATLLTTRVRTAVALGLTAFVFALAVLHWGHTKSGWLLSLGFVPHGWPQVAVNVVFYGYLCWLGFWSIRGTLGRERFFMVGWFVSILLSPLERVRPQWAAALEHIGTLGLAMALLAALSLLLAPADVVASNGRTNAT